MFSRRFSDSPQKPLFDNRQLFMLLWPLIAEQLLAVFVGMVDVLMVSLVGEYAVSGVSLVDAVNNLIIQVLFALTAGGTVVCAQYIGKKNMALASHAGAQLLSITTAFFFLISMFFLIGGKALLSLIFGAVEPAVMENAAVYLSYTALSFPFLAIYNSCAAIFRANRKSAIALYVSLAMNLINIAGNAICIIGLKMGVSGVAIPTLIARAFAASLILFLLQRPQNILRISSLKDFQPDLPTIRRILSIGVPNGIESGIFQFGKLTLQRLVSTLGTASIAAFAVASNLVNYLYLPGNALGAGLITIVGQCYGADDKEQAKWYARRLLLLNYLMLLFLSTGLIAGRGFFVGCYHLSGTAASLAEGLVFIHSAAMILWPPGFLLPHYFRAIGQSAFTMKVSISCMWIFRIGLAYVYIRLLHMNVLGIWYAMFVDWIFRAGIYIHRFRKGPEA